MPTPSSVAQGQGSCIHVLLLRWKQVTPNPAPKLGYVQTTSGSCESQSWKPNLPTNSCSSCARVYQTQPYPNLWLGWQSLWFLSPCLSPTLLLVTVHFPSTTLSTYYKWDLASRGYRSQRLSLTEAIAHRGRLLQQLTTLCSPETLRTLPRPWHRELLPRDLP